MTPSEPEPDLDRTLARLGRTAANEPFDEHEVWALAAGELAPVPAQAAASRILGNRRAAEELGLASHVLDDRDQPDSEAARRSADRVLERIRQGAKPKAPASRLRLLGPLLLGMAAIAVVSLWIHLAGTPPGALQCTVADLAPQRLRGGGAVTGLSYRLELSPNRPSHVLLLAVSKQADGLAVTWQFPPHPERLAATESAERTWPKNPLPIGPTTIPPLAAEPFAVRCADGDASALQLVVHSSEAIEHGKSDATVQALRSVLVGRRLDQATADALTRLLVGNGWMADTVWLRLP